MDESDAFEREVDNAKEALASKLAVISFMEGKARIDNWLDRELMLRLALVLSLEEGRHEVEEESDDGGVDSKLAVILLQLIEVDADESTEVAYEDMMEVFATLDVAMTAAAAAVMAAVAAAAASHSSARCHHHPGMSRDDQSSFSECDKQCNWCEYRLCFDKNLR